MTSPLLNLEKPIVLERESGPSAFGNIIVNGRRPRQIVGFRQDVPRSPY